MNNQPAATEMSDESMLEPIFETTGKNAHMPIGVSNTTAHGVCKPYVKSSVHVWSARESVYLLLAMAASSILTYGNFH